jgi:hypothetical protein
MMTAVDEMATEVRTMARELALGEYSKEKFYDNSTSTGEFERNGLACVKNGGYNAVDSRRLRRLTGERWPSRAFAACFSPSLP